MFSGFAPAAFRWFEGLEADNSREYFQRTRETYDRAVRGELEALLDELAPAGATVKVFRQHRDLRFSRDKSPYKTRTYGIAQSARWTGGYIEVSARGLYAGTGHHQLDADRLSRFREAVAGPPGEELAAAVLRARELGLEVVGQELKTVPRGYDRDHPRGELLRHKRVIAGARLAPGADGIVRERALAHVRGTWEAAEPIVTWLDTHLGHP